MNKQRLHVGSLARIVAVIVLLLSIALPAKATINQNTQAAFRELLTPLEKQWLSQHPVIRVQSERDSVPYNFYRDKPEGYSIDYITALSAIIGVEVEFVHGPSWQEFLQMMDNGQLDVMTNIVNTTERREFLLFTRSYQNLLEGIFIKQGNERFDSLEALKGKRLAIVEGFYEHGLLKQHYPEINLHLVKSNIEAIEAVLSGEADATLSDSALINYVVKENTIGGIILSSFVRDKRFENVVSLAVRKDWPVLRDILQKAMDFVSAEQLERIHQKWHPGAVTFDIQPSQIDAAKQLPFSKQLLDTENLIIIVLLIIIVVVMLVLMFRLLLRSRIDPKAYQFSSPAVKQLTVILNGLLVISSLIVGWWALNTINNKIREDIRDSLRTVVRTTLETLKIWVKDQKQVLINVANDPQLSQLARAQCLRYAAGDKQISHELNAMFETFQQRLGSLDFALINPDGYVVASVHDSQIGKLHGILKHRKSLFERVVAGDTVLVPPIPADVDLPGSGKIAGLGSSPTMYFAAPLINAQGEVFGVIAQRVNPAAEFSRLHLLGRIGLSGETYSFDDTGQLLSKSRFDGHLMDVGLIGQLDQSILSVDIRDPGGNLLEGYRNLEPRSKWPLTLMAQSAMNESTGYNVDGYRDYRGVEVFGAWVWSNEVGLGITTEIDTEEAMEAYVVARWVVIVTLLATVSVAILFSVFFMVIGHRANTFLQHARDELELQVTERTGQLQNAVDQAQAANEAKSTFLAGMSHEIRTPLNGLLGMLSLVQKSHLDDQQHHRLSVAESCAHSLLTLINDILDFSKIEAGKLDLESVEFDIVSLLDEAVRSQVYLCNEKSVELLLDVSNLPHTNVIGDPNRIRQVLLNLIGNAIKFTHLGEITVEAAIKLKADGRPVFQCCVRDTGIGIPPDRLSYLFDSFTQVDASTTRKYGGTGLGLAICKKLCHLMEGDITVTSKLGEGSCFCFSVALEKGIHELAPQSKRDLSGLKVLLADTNKSNCDIISRQLRIWGVKVTTVNNAQEAINHFKGEDALRFDAALIDHKLPPYHNQFLHDYLMQQSNLDKLAVVMLAEITQLDKVEKLTEQGVDGYLLKPLSNSDLYNTLLSIERKKPILQSGQLAMQQYKGRAAGSSPALCQTFRILLVEDNEINQEVVRGLLAEYNLGCDCAYNGIEALNMLRESSPKMPYDLIFMDCQMPQLDGYQTTEMIRKGRAGAHYSDVVIVALTANALVSDRQKCLDAGMNDYLVKPIELDRLNEVLNKWQKAGIDNQASIQTPSQTSTQNSTGVLDTAKAAADKKAAKEDVKKAEKVSQKFNFNCPDNLTMFVLNKNFATLFGNANTLVKSLELYIKQYRDFSQNIEQETDMTVISRHIHTLKGTSGSLQLKPVYLMCKEVEQHFRDDGTFEPTMMAQLKSMVEKSVWEAEQMILANKNE